jgi:hypothetical protein
MNELLKEMQKTLTPEACAIIAAHIKSANCRMDTDASREVQHLGNAIVTQLLGVKSYNAICDEIGL